MLRHAAGLFAYVGVLALLAIVGIHLWEELLAGEAGEPAAKAGWSMDVRSIPRSLRVSSICLKKQRPTRFSGIPKAAEWTDACFSHTGRVGGTA
jgi:hypothetical protein